MNASQDRLALYQEVCRLCDNDREGVHSIAVAINSDARLQDMILRAANSIQNLLPRPAGSTQHAILILGISRVHAMVLAELERLRRLAAERAHRFDAPHAVPGPHAVETNAATS